MASEIKPSAPPYEEYVPLVPPGDDDIGELLVLESTPNASYYTDAKIERIRLYVFAAICAAGSAAVIGLSVTGVIPGPCVYLAVPLFCLAIASVCVAMQILDYEDPLELQAMKDAAPLLTYRQLISKHGLPNINLYNIISIEALREKFFMCIRGMRFCNFHREFSIEDLELHGVVTFAESEALNNLKNRFESKTSNLTAIYLEIDKRYPYRLNLELNHLDVRIQQEQLQYTTRMQKTEEQWTETVEKGLKNISQNNWTYQKEKGRLEAQKIAAIARVKVDAQKDLNEALRQIRIAREKVSQDSTAIDQQERWNQERDVAFRENSRAFAAIEEAFAQWLGNLPR